VATYIALVHQIAVGRCRASFPDLPGCVAEGGSLDEAIALASRFRCPADVAVATDPAAAEAQERRGKRRSEAQGDHKRHR
jgi:hypothetical protein